MLKVYMYFPFKEEKLTFYYYLACENWEGINK